MARPHDHFDFMFTLSNNAFVSQLRAMVSIFYHITKLYTVGFTLSSPQLYIIAHLTFLLYFTGFLKDRLLSRWGTTGGFSCWGPHRQNNNSIGSRARPFNRHLDGWRLCSSSHGRYTFLLIFLITLFPTLNQLPTGSLLYIEVNWLYPPDNWSTFPEDFLLFLFETICHVFPAKALTCLS